MVNVNVSDVCVLQTVARSAHCGPVTSTQSRHTTTRAATRRTPSARGWWRRRPTRCSAWSSSTPSSSSASGARACTGWRSSPSPTRPCPACASAARVDPTASSRRAAGGSLSASSRPARRHTATRASGPSSKQVRAMWLASTSQAATSRHTRLTMIAESESVQLLSVSKLNAHHVA